MAAPVVLRRWRSRSEIRAGLSKDWAGALSLIAPTLSGAFASVIIPSRPGPRSAAQSIVVRGMAKRVKYGEVTHRLYQIPSRRGCQRKRNDFREGSFSTGASRCLPSSVRFDLKAAIIAHAILASLSASAMAATSSSSMLVWRTFDQSSQTRSPHSHLNKLITARPLRGSGNRHSNRSFSELQRLHFRGGASARETFSSLIIYAECSQLGATYTAGS